jgi:hypothetical protein
MTRGLAGAEHVKWFMMFSETSILIHIWICMVARMNICIYICIMYIYILGIFLFSTDFHIFSEGWLNHQPDIHWRPYRIKWTYHGYQYQGHGLPQSTGTRMITRRYWDSGTFVVDGEFRAKLKGVVYIYMYYIYMANGYLHLAEMHIQKKCGPWDHVALWPLWLGNLQIPWFGSLFVHSTLYFNMLIHINTICLY